MACQCCGANAQTKYVEYYQNIGMLFMRMHKSIAGEMCKSCVHKYFWEFTLVNLFLGWWGVISFIVTPFFILNNLVRYICCLGMASVPPQAGPVLLTNDAIARLKPHTQEIFRRLDNGEPLQGVASDVARVSGAMPEQVHRYVQAVLQSQSGNR